MGDVSKQLNAIDRQAQKAFSGFDQIGDRLSSIGTGLTAALTLPLAGIGIAVTKTAGDFEHSLNKIKAFGEITGAELEKVEALAIKLGKDTKFSAQEAADGMAILAAAGFKTNEILEASAGVLDLAAAGELAVADAAKLTKDILGQFGLSASSAGHAADVLAQASKDSSATLQEMATTLTYVGPVAHNLSLGIEETTAAIIALDKGGIRGEKAGTGLREVFTRLIAPPKAAALAIADLGIKVNDVAGKFVGLPSITAQFQAGLAKLGTDAERTAKLIKIFGVEGQTAASILIQNGGAALDQYGKKLHEVDGVAKETAKTLNSGFKGAVEELSGSIETASISLGKALLPLVTEIAKRVQAFVNDSVIPAIEAFRALPLPVQATVLALAGIAAVIGPALLILGQMAIALAAIGPAFTSLTGVALLFASKAVPVVTGAFAAITAAAATTGRGLVVAFAELGATSLKGIGTLVTAIAGIPSALASIPAASATAFANMLTTIGQVVNIIRAQLLIAFEQTVAGLVKIGASISTANFSGLLASIQAVSAAIQAQLVLSLASLTGAIANITFAVQAGLVGALTVAETALLALAGGVVFAAASFAAWKLGEWAYAQFPAVQQLFDKIRDLVFSIPIAGKALQEFFVGTGVSAQGAGEFAASTAKLESELKALGITVDRGNKSVTEYWRALVEAGEKSGKFAASTETDAAKIAAIKKQIQETEKATALYNEALRQLGKTSGTTSGSHDALKDAVKRTEAAFKSALKAYDDGKISIEQLGKAQENLIRAQDAADPERVAKRQEAAFFAQSDAYDQMVKDIVKLSADVKQAGKDVTDGTVKNALLFQQAHEAMSKSVAKEVAIIVPFYNRIPAALIGVKDSTIATVNFLASQADLLAKAFGGASVLAIDALQKLQSAEQGMAAESKKTNDDRRKSVQDLATSYEIAGVKSVAQLESLVADTRKAYDQIAKAEGSGSTGALAARVKATEAQIDLNRRTYGTVGQDQLDALATQQAQLDAALGKQTKSQKDWAKRVIQIINDLKRDIARGLADAFKNIFFDSDGFNQKLEEDSNNLRGQLADRADAIEEFQRTTADKIANVNSGYAEQLARETGELRDQLATRIGDYEDYAKEVAGKLETLRGAEASRLSEEIGKLADALRDKEAAYEDYVGEVAAKEQEIRETHAARLAEQLADLRDNLADKAEAYADYAAEANRNLARIGEDLNESISDDTRSANRRTEDENRDFARDSEKLNEDLQKAQKKGDKEETANIKRELARRTEDHERALKRIKEDLDEQVSDARRQAERQTSDLQDNLRIRTREHDQYVADNIAAQARVTEENQKDLDKQLADLQASLDRRTAELLAFRAQTDLDIAGARASSQARLAGEEKDLADSLGKRRSELESYRAAVEEKIAALTELYKKKQAEEVAALNLEFGNKLKEYDTYRTGVEQKLKELEDAHKGPLDRIRDMFTNVFKAAGDAILEVASERVIGKLVSKIGELVIELFPSLGKAINSALGIGASAASAAGGVAAGAGQAAGAAGSVAGAASQAGGAAASGLSGIINVVSGVVTALASVAQVIQGFRAEGTQNAIEENTRFAQIGIIGPAGLVETSRVFMPYLKLINDFNYQVAAPWMAAIQFWTESLFMAPIDRVHDLISNKTNAYLEQIANGGMSFVGTGTANIVIHTNTYLDSRLIANAVTEHNESYGGGI